MSVIDKHYLVLLGLDGARILFDGWSGITIKTSTNIKVSGFEIEGIAGKISAAEASNNRLRMTGLTVLGQSSGHCGTMECGSCASEDSCSSAKFCVWNSAYETCSPKALSRYYGNGITVADVNFSTFSSLLVHEAVAGGIHTSRVDNTDIKNCTVFDNMWWAPNAPSGIVFADSEGSGVNTVEKCVAFGNRNFLPFYTESISLIEGGHVAKQNYSAWNQDYIIDGSGECSGKQESLLNYFTINLIAHNFDFQ